MRSQIVAILFCSLIVAGCSRIYGPIQEVEAFGAAVEPVMEEMSKAVAADPTEAGVDKAAKIFESKKADLKARRDAIDAAPQGMNVDWQSLLWKINDRIKAHADGIVTATGYDTLAEAKAKQLRGDIEKTFKLR